MKHPEPFAPCEAYNEDLGTIAFVRAQMPGAETLARALELLKTVADPTRFTLLYALARHELCVCELANLVELPSTAVSHQLRYLRERGFIASRKEGKFAYYYIVDDAIRSLLNDTVTAAQEAPAVQELEAVG